MTNVRILIELDNRIRRSKRTEKHRWYLQWIIICQIRADTIHRFRNTDVARPEQRQRLIDIFINSVYVFDDHAVITFNYKDGTKTVSLMEIEASGVGSSLSSLGEPQEKA